MDPIFIPILALLIPIVAIVAGTYQKIAKAKAEAQAQLGKATSHLEDELADAQAERDRLKTRIEALEAIVTSEGFDLEREARKAGITDRQGRVDPSLLTDDPADLEGGTRTPRRRVR
ncbi:hypothetical protein [Rubrivirga sp.]|uniref:hypothetical protein n=1 Tax=Rubrivirga sp. TaxID=1885344 RepID=UPI003C718E07